MPQSTPVDKLEFLILVDNCIEWISRLPPGFTHEVPQHISRPPPNAPPKDPITGLPILDLDNYCCGAHGLAILIKTTIDGETSQVLLDAGPEGLSIERNVKAMKVPLRDLDAIVLSHWHRDHSGGIPKVLKMRRQQRFQIGKESDEANRIPIQPIKVDLHPDRPNRRGISVPPDFKPAIQLPLDPTFAEITSLGGTVDLHDEFHEIVTVVGTDPNTGGDPSSRSTGVGVSGKIPRKFPFEKGLIGAITWMKDDGPDGNGEEGWFTDDQIWDERYVVVDVKAKGLVILSSCSHAGICNVVADAMERYQRPVYMIVGGLHLVPTPQQPLKETIDFISRRLQPRPKYVLPLHCSGMEARAALRHALGDGCVAAGVGMKVVVDSVDGLGEEGKKSVDQVDLAIDELHLQILE